MENSKPKLALGSTTWKSISLDSIGEIRTGSTPKIKDADNVGGPYYWVTPTDISGKEINTTNIMLSEKGLESARVIPANSLLVTCIASIGKNCILRSTGSCNQQINALTPYSNYDLDFLYYLLCNKEQVLHNNAGHGGMEILNKTEFSKLVFKVPKLEEQQKIAEFFTALDEKIRCLDDLAKCFSQSMQGVLNKVFTQQISFKDENGNNYSEWTSKTIKDVAPLQRGFDLPTSQLQDGECTVIYSNGQTAKHSAFKCDGCAVVTGRSGTIGKVFYLDNCKYWPHNTTLWVTDFCGNNPKFIYYLLKFVGLERFSTGTGVPTLNRNDVHDYVVKIPSIDEQTKIVEFLDCYNKKLNLLISKKHAFQELKKAFMQRMFV
ncbi:restriction endonuclease subunit S [Anaerobiospirillum succiniciproducens]|uniref:restriction endonuclease subunit S n=1 Tax=Anaerobiospirillum succiniciproducens TaxID=13335 RepID=UPI002353BA71|nr:restriction endonuclease subunit S [Anaerobiospirillum succiniciproducens]MCI6864197.1 restriction endonuclease subunit S [Anaerobiospirillum succiniciproducens]